MESAITLLSPISPCQYLPDRLWQLRYELVPNLEPADYMQRLQLGWRRFGWAIFRPECPSCRMCQSLRVPVAAFRPSSSQRRAWKGNHGQVSVRVGVPSLSRDRLDLWARFHRHGQETKGWPAEAGGDPGILLENPFPTEEWTYYVGNRLVAVAYVDALPEALSAIYCYYDPAERARSLGTFNILSLLTSARERGLPHVYLGYYVAGCRSMEYKRKFRPNEVLRPDGEWEAFEVGCPCVSPAAPELAGPPRCDRRTAE
jgi:arginine-tRNA-protein transferase